MANARIGIGDELAGKGKERRHTTYSEYQAKEKDSNFELVEERLKKEYALRTKLQSKLNSQDLKEKEKAQAALAKYSAKLEREERKKYLQEQLSSGASTKEERRELRKMEAADGMQQSLVKALENSVAAIGKTISAINNKVDGYISTWTQYTAGINTRLQGTSKTFDNISGLISGKLAGSPYVKQTEVLEKLNSLVEQGISYNVEQRAFLSAMTDKIVTTFDAANATLLRIIRLQQADSTVARMGMESALNKFLNSTFEDSSYLNNLYDTVETSLVEAISQLSHTAGVELEYVVQKWLGSLSSVGFSDSTLSTLAQGIGYLASGDINSLSSNQALQNLLVMGANRAGLNYSSLLSGGLTAQSANELLRGVVEYGQEIANTNNLVVKSQYANLFGMTISDMTALLQLSSQDLVNISSNMLTYSQTVKETNDQLKTVGSRMSTADLVQNVFDNVMLSAAQGIANSTGLYATWLVTNLVEQATGGIDIPSISAFVMGTGVALDLNTTVTELMKSGLVGMSLLGQIGNIVSGLSSGGALSLEGWGAEAFTSRGTGFTGIQSGASVTTSNTAYVGNSSGSDIYSSTITSATNEATQSVEGMDEAQKNSEEMPANIEAILGILEAVFDNSNSLRVTVENYGLINTERSTLG